MNSIIETLIKLIEAKKQDEALAQRKEEAQAEHQIRLEELGQRSKVDKATIAHQKAVQALAEAKTIADAEADFRAQALTGARRLQGETALPERNAPWRPPGNVPYDIPEEDIRAETLRKFTPYDTQYFQGPLGPQEVQGVVPYEDARAQKLEEFKQQLGLDVLKAGLTAKAQEAVRQPGREALRRQQDAAAMERENARILAQQDTAAKNREVQERIAGNRNATALQVANINKSAKVQLDAEALSPVVESVILGETKLPPGNNGIAVTRSIKSQGFAVPDQANLKKVPYVNTMLDIANRIQGMIPKLSTAPLGAKITGMVTSIWPTDLANEYKAMGIDATMAAREAGEKGNFSNTDIGRAYAALIEPGITQSQARERLNILRVKVYNKLLNESLGGLADKQKLLILDKYNIDPSSIPTIVNNKVLHLPSGEVLPKYVLGAKSGKWGVYDPQLGTYKEVQ